MSAIDVQNYPYPFFAREGWPFIAISLLVFFALVILDLFFGAFIAFILSVFTFQFFRDPKRSGPNDDTVITSPADGRAMTARRRLPRVPIIARGTVSATPRRARVTASSDLGATTVPTSLRVATVRVTVTVSARPVSATTCTPESSAVIVRVRTCVTDKVRAITAFARATLVSVGRIVRRSFPRMPLVTAPQ